MPAPARRSLLPHEHGAYGQIALPLACALGPGRPGTAAALLAAGAFAGFLSYEPLLVAAGSRGRRAREEDGPRARRLAASLLAAAVALAGTGLLLASPAARLASAVPPVLAAVVALLVRLERDRTVAGEVAVAVALSSAGLPVAVASGVSPYHPILPMAFQPVPVYRDWHHFPSVFPPTGKHPLQSMWYARNHESCPIDPDA